jgi:ubiquinone/menaquinone biosynthesis C-methylase UbiE
MNPEAEAAELLVSPGVGEELKPHLDITKDVGFIAIDSSIDSVATVTMPAEVEIPPSNLEDARAAGWQSATRSLAESLGTSSHMLKSLASKIAEEQPGLSVTFIDARNRQCVCFHPDVIEKAANELQTRVQMPEGWLSAKDLAQECGIDQKNISVIHRELRKLTEDESGDNVRHIGLRKVTYIAPELAEKIRDKFTVDKAPEGWLSRSDALKSASDDPKVQAVIDNYIETHPEVVKVGRRSRGRISEYWEPTAAREIRAEVRKIIKPNETQTPEGWATTKSLSEELSLKPHQIYGMAKKFVGDGEVGHRLFTNSDGEKSRYLPPSVVEYIREQAEMRQKAPEAWVDRSTLARTLDCAPALIRKLADLFAEEDEDLVAKHLNSNNRMAEHYHPTLVQKIQEEITALKIMAEGKMSLSEVIEELGISTVLARRYFDSLQAEQPELFEAIPSHKQAETVCSPEVVKLIKAQIVLSDTVPEGWTTDNKISRQLKAHQRTIQSIVNEVLKEDPDLFISSSIMALGKDGKIYEYYAPGLAKQIETKYTEHNQLRTSPAPEGWLHTKGAADALGSHPRIIKQLSSEFKEEHPEWFGTYKASNGRVIDFYHPDLLTAIGSRINNEDAAPEGWMTRTGLAEQLDISHQTVGKLVEKYREDHPALFQEFRVIKNNGSKGGISEFYDPQLIEMVRQEAADRKDPPEGWMAAGALAVSLSCNRSTITEYIEMLRPDNEDNFGVFKGKQGVLAEHISAEFATQISQIYSERNEGRINRRELAQEEAEEARLTTDAEHFVKELADGISLEAEQYHQLTSLFGGEFGMDLIFHFRPEYKKLSVPKVKSVIAEYLGDFLPPTGYLDLECLKVGADLLTNPNFQEAFSEVVKSYCLRKFNEVRADDHILDASHFTTIINELKQATAELRSSQIAEVLDNIESYFTSLFDIIMPSHVIDELRTDRPFPDINQRINIKELDLREKMLIADEMGLGKSASVILAKEALGVSCALIIAPSNVIETWQDYLSDKVEDGEQLGYFKPDEAPNVLVIESPADLELIDTTKYGYVLLSIEKLNHGYRRALETHDFDMLIVDEVHKFKNITHGKRSDCLLQLAEQFNSGETGQKFIALLSGTPIPNKPRDVGLVLKMLYPDMFKTINNKQLTQMILDGDMLDIRGLLVPRMQMKKLQESVQMPNLREETKWLELTDYEKDIYNILIEEDELTATQKLHILRKFLVNPALVEATPDVMSTKIQSVSEALDESFMNKDKIVMFVNGYINGVISGEEETIISGLGLPPDISVHTIIGQTLHDDRVAIQHALKTYNGKMLVLVSGQTADVGVNFSGADEVMFYNEPWTEYDKRQQRGRVYRFGQTNDITSTTFITKATIEEGMSRYIEAKHKAVEKLLHGIPLAEIEREMLKAEEAAGDEELDVNPELASYYFSSWDRMMKIYAYVKELGEDDFVQFLQKYGEMYASCYTDMGSRSYQANASRLSGTVISRMAHESGQNIGRLGILDVASGPEMLRRHIPEAHADKVVSLDINQHHFAQAGQNRINGSFVKLPIADKSVEYVNMSLALHYTSFLPSKKNYERIEVLQEVNRVMHVGGRAVITLMHTLDLKHDDQFKRAIAKLGFVVVDGYSGRVESGNHFASRLITLEKVADCSRTTSEIVQSLGQDIHGFKLRKPDKEPNMKDSRKIATEFVIGDSQMIRTILNAADQHILEEEQQLTVDMNAIKEKHQSIKGIPAEEIIRGGYSRIFNGKSYVLFKGLQSAAGAVVLR